MKRIALFIILLALVPTSVWADPPGPPIWNYDLKVDKADFPRGMNATRFKVWVATIYEAGRNAIWMSGHKYGMVEGQPIPVSVFQCVMFTFGYEYATKMGWNGVASTLKPMKDQWCKDDGPGGPGAVAAAIIRDAEAAYIAKHGAKARAWGELQESDIKAISGNAATFTVTIGTGAALLLILGSLITG